MRWCNQEVLILGGTGSLGKALTKLLQTQYHPKGIRIFSRSEMHQWQMRQELSDMGILDNVAFLIGDIRDYTRVELAMQKVDIVINCAAMKQITACQENPMEAVVTNIIGSQNILRAGLKTKPKKILGISTDKAVEAANLYGRTKACMENLFIHGNIYSGGRIPMFSCTRYGNVLGSNGSVVQAFASQANANNGEISITDTKMTRFWTTLPIMAQFIIDSLIIMEGAEIFIPKMGSCSILKLAQSLGHDKYKIIGIRPGEKLHEILIAKEESCNVFELENSYIISKENTPIKHAEFEYKSNTNPWELTKNDLYKMLST